MPIPASEDIVQRILTGAFLSSFIENEGNYFPDNNATQDIYLKALMENRSYFKQLFSEDPQYCSKNVIAPFIIKILDVLEKSQVEGFDDIYHQWQINHPSITHPAPGSNENETVDILNRAIQYAKQTLKLGAANKSGDISRTAGFSFEAVKRSRAEFTYMKTEKWKLQQTNKIHSIPIPRSSTQFSDYFQTDEMTFLEELYTKILTAKKFRAGNCAEHSMLALDYLFKHAGKQIQSIEYIELTNVDHVFLVVEIDNMKWAIDPWAYRTGIVYPMNEYDTEIIRIMKFLVDEANAVMINIQARKAFALLKGAPIEPTEFTINLSSIKEKVKSMMIDSQNVSKYARPVPTYHIKPQDENYVYPNHLEQMFDVIIADEYYLMEQSIRRDKFKQSVTIKDIIKHYEDTHREKFKNVLQEAKNNERFKDVPYQAAPLSPQSAAFQDKSIEETVKLYTNLYFACERGNVNEVKTLINHQKIDLNDKFFKEYPLLYIALNNKHYDVFEQLLTRSEFNINAKGKDGLTVWMKAIKDGQTEQVIHLLKDPKIFPKIDLQMTDSVNCNALLLACKNEDADLVNVLLPKCDFDMLNARNDRDTSAWSEALESRNIKLIESFLNHPEIDLLLNLPETEVIVKHYGTSEIVAMLQHRKKQIDDGIPTHERTPYLPSATFQPQKNLTNQDENLEQTKVEVKNPRWKL